VNGGPGVTRHYFLNAKPALVLNKEDKSQTFFLSHPEARSEACLFQLGGSCMEQI
jgi:hypothetical protein